VGELKDVLIRLAYNPKVHQMIDIILVDNLEMHGLLLSRDWSFVLHGYFATDWSHIWLPYNGKQNKIKVDKERYMKHVVIYLNDPSEPIMFNNSIVENYILDSFFGNHIVKLPYMRNHSHNLKSFTTLKLLTQIVT